MDDYSYITAMKKIWNRNKGEYQINQCFNVFNLI